MGVDFYACKSCGESRYSEYVGSCQECGESLCTNCLLNTEGNTSPYKYYYGYKYDPKNTDRNTFYEIKEGEYEEGDLVDDTEIQACHCPFCSGDKINKELLLTFILDTYGFEQDELWKTYLKSKNK